MKRSEDPAGLPGHPEMSGRYIRDIDSQQWLNAENGGRGKATIMVKTRETTAFVRTLRSGNGRGKNIGNREEKVSVNIWILSTLIV